MNHVLKTLRATYTNAVNQREQNLQWRTQSEDKAAKYQKQVDYWAAVADQHQATIEAITALTLSQETT